ncbi:MAG: hypothetical protein AAGC65_16405 [Mucilaginibacter sp.]|uniref:hypothetical protein n=1 Tax=Mucilaginibacter sp. TaxID=1882438 RepID=UPI00319F84AE
MKSKLNLRHLLFFFILLITASVARAQSESPEKGFYVLINNKDSMSVTTVQFYNDEQQLIYEERLQGKKLNLDRKKVRRLLNSCLSKALLAWNYKKEVLLNKNWVATMVR